MSYQDEKHDSTDATMAFTTQDAELAAIAREYVDANNERKELDERLQSLRRDHLAATRKRDDLRSSAKRDKAVALDARALALAEGRPTDGIKSPAQIDSELQAAESEAEVLERAIERVQDRIHGTAFVTQPILGRFMRRLRELNEDLIRGPSAAAAPLRDLLSAIFGLRRDDSNAAFAAFADLVRVGDGTGFYVFVPFDTSGAKRTVEDLIADAVKGSTATATSGHRR